MGDKGDTVDQEIGRVARPQHGVVSLRQLMGAGLSRSAVSKRVRSGRLHRIHHGVYAVGHRALSNEARWMAAVLACGEGAVLSHRSAAALWGLLPASGPATGREGGRIHVSVPSTAGKRRRKGIRLHRCPSLALPSSPPSPTPSAGRGSTRAGAPGLVTDHDGIPVTTPARTIADLRGCASAAEVRKAIRKAEVLGLRTELAPRREPTRSELEDIFLTFCERHEIPRPAVNVDIGRHEVDFVWIDLRVAVETDSYRFHRGRMAFENDHERDLDLRAAGYDVVRLTYRQVTSQPAKCATAVHAALAEARAVPKGARRSST